MQAFKTTIGRLLRKVGQAVPDIFPFRAIGNRVLWPLHKAFCPGGGTIDVLGLQMHLDPAECVDRNLWFTPHLYDSAEIRFAIKILGAGGCFVDLGANVGWWSLRIRQACPETQILALEANPDTFAQLINNFSLNEFQDIIGLNVACADKTGQLRLHCVDNGNRGGDSLFARPSSNRTINVFAETLRGILNKYLPDEKIGFLKLDIEGAEFLVLRHFLEHTADTGLPTAICVEHLHSNEIDGMLRRRGYRRTLTTRENSVYQRR